MRLDYGLQLSFRSLLLSDNSIFVVKILFNHSIFTSSSGYLSIKPSLSKGMGDGGS